MRLYYGSDITIDNIILTESSGICFDASKRENLRKQIKNSIYITELPNMTAQ